MQKQNALFQYFSDTFDHLIEIDKKEGRYDMGILGKLLGQVWALHPVPRVHWSPVASEAHRIRYVKSIIEWL